MWGNEPSQNHLAKMSVEFAVSFFTPNIFSNIFLPLLIAANSFQFSFSISTKNAAQIQSKRHSELMIGPEGKCPEMLGPLFCFNGGQCLAHFGQNNLFNFSCR
jgi:hypothetical protein